MSAVRALLAPLVVLIVPHTPLSAQHIDPDHQWDSDQWQHAASGAAVDLSLRGPWLAPSWQRWYTRVAITAAIGIGYEAAQTVSNRRDGLEGTGYGFGVLDIVADVAGALAAEAATALLGRVFGSGDHAGSTAPPPVTATRGPATRAATVATFDWPSPPHWPSPTPQRATRRVSSRGNFEVPF